MRHNMPCTASDGRPFWVKSRTQAANDRCQFFPLEADIHQSDGYVSFVPTTEVPASFVHLVGQRKRHRRHGYVRL
jgi:hypothetical protein